eukprot:10269096-Prorocentrum_lima.AAC.1
MQQVQTRKLLDLAQGEDVDDPRAHLLGALSMELEPNEVVDRQTEFVNVIERAAATVEEYRS